VEAFGFHHAIDYKALEEGSLEALVSAIKKVAPKGVHMVFENVGGLQFEAAFKCLAVGGRIAVCGGIVGYGQEKPVTVAIDQTAMSEFWAGREERGARVGELLPCLT
jgi:NADPH-dependent curcumin reductase CurA